MSIRIENVSGSLTYVKVKRIIGKEPIAEKDNVKTFEAGVYIVVATRDWPPGADPEAESRALGSGQSMQIEDEGKFAEFELDTKDKDIDVLAVEDIDEEDGLGYRLVRSGLDKFPPKHRLH